MGTPECNGALRQARPGSGASKRVRRRLTPFPGEGKGLTVRLLDPCNKDAYSTYKAILANTMHSTRCSRGVREARGVCPVVATGEVMEEGKVMAKEAASAVAKKAVTVMATEVAKEAATMVATVAAMWRWWWRWCGRRRRDGRRLRRRRAWCWRRR